MKKRWLGLLAPLAALPIVLGSGAGAAAGWQTFSSGSAVARPGQEAFAAMDVTSVTRRHPVEVRLTFTDRDFKGRTDVGWSIAGVKERFDAPMPTMWTRHGSGDYLLPKTFTISIPSWVDFAVVSIWTHAGYDDGQPLRSVHPLHFTMQARY